MIIKRMMMNLHIDKIIVCQKKLNILASGMKKLNKEKVKALKSGLMGQDMMDIGEMIKLMEEVGWYIKRVMYMRESLLMIKQKDMVFILIVMGLSMKVNGNMINNMVKEKKLG
jgi:hypothetical protein